MSAAAFILRCLGRGLDFSSRASRREYWMFLPFGLVLPVLAFIALGAADWPSAWVERIAVAALFLIPLAAVTARRLNDAGIDSDTLWIPTGALVTFLAGLVLTGRFFGWLDIFFDDVDGPGILGLIFVFGPIVLGIVLALAAAFFYGLFTGASLFGHMLLPSEPGSNKHGPNPYEVTP